MVLEGEKKKQKCSGCGYSPRGKADNVILKEKVANGKDKQIEIRSKKIETYPKTDEKCDKCGNNKAYYWTLQTRAGDEAETRFFECVKCSHRWREY